MTTTFAFDDVPLSEDNSHSTKGQHDQLSPTDTASVVGVDGLVAGTGPASAAGMRAEYWVCERLGAAGLPVPRVLTIGDTTGLASGQSTLLSPSEGCPLVNSTDLTHDQRLTVAYEVGQFIARMHATASDHRFGNWRQLEDGTHYTRWSEWPVAYFEHYVGWSDQLGGAADRELVRDLGQLVVETMSYFDLVESAVITHRDCRFENVLQFGGHLAGVVGFENWMFADPACDFAVEDQWDYIGTGCCDAVYAGYTALRPLSAGHHEKVLVYRLLRHFGDVVAHYANGDFAKSQRAAAVVRTGLNKR